MDDRAIVLSRLPGVDILEPHSGSSQEEAPDPGSALTLRPGATFFDPSGIDAPRAPKGPNVIAKGEALEIWAPPIPEALRGRNTNQLWEVFAEKLPSLGSKMATLQDLPALQDKMAWIDEDAKPFVKDLGIKEARDIWSAEVGITLAECVVAESGSILISNAPGRRRMGSLAPEIHVVLVKSDQIVATIEQALAKIPERSTTLITGSSRTADIEGVLVRGVHGPREVWIVRV